ncbi:MAG TPA: methylamine utilization protein [Chromatiaceae bacterium]|nr:methylamine utilization protein [Chromatiaceae bacterium]
MNQRLVTSIIAIASGLIMASGAAVAKEYTVGQAGKAFTQDKITISVGDVVHFENNDPFFHNVFSLSSTKTFDLGSYPKGDARSVTFDEPGVIEVECALHGDMFMLIEVE